MKIFFMLTAALMACEARKHHKGPKGKGMVSLIKVCELQDICDEDQYGPWIIEKGNRKSCDELEGMNKRDAFSGMDKYQCNNVRFRIFSILELYRHNATFLGTIGYLCTLFQRY